MRESTDIVSVRVIYLGAATDSGRQARQILGLPEVFPRSPS